MELAREAYFDKVRDSILFNPIASVISDPNLPDNPIVAVNDAFCKLTQYPPEEVIGRNCKFLAGNETEIWLTEKIRQGVRDHSPVLVEILNYKRDGTKFRNAVLVAPMFDDDDALRYFIGTQVELPEETWEHSPCRKQHARALVGDLSKRQREVLALISKGHRTRQIADELSLSTKTIEMHRSLLFRKLHATNVADVVRIAMDAGI